MLYESVTFDPDSVDAELVQQAIALLREASGDVEPQTGAPGSDPSSTPVKFVLSGNECSNFLSYASLWASLPENEQSAPWGILAAALDDELTIKITRVMVSMRRACEEGVKKTTKQIEEFGSTVCSNMFTTVDTSEDTVNFCDQMVDDFTQGKLSEMLDILRDDKYETDHDATFDSAAKRVPELITATKERIAASKTLAYDIVALLLKFKTSTDADHSKLDSLLPLAFDLPQPVFVIAGVVLGPPGSETAALAVLLALLHSLGGAFDDDESIQLMYEFVEYIPAYRMEYLPKMPPASAAASILCDFFTQQASYYDKISLYLSAVSLAAGMQMLANRKTFINDGSSGALARNKDLEADAQALRKQMGLALSAQAT